MASHLLDPDRHDADAAVLRDVATGVDNIHIVELRTWLDEQPDPPERSDGSHGSPAGAVEVAGRLLVPLILDRARR